MHIFSPILCLMRIMHLNIHVYALLKLCCKRIWFLYHTSVCSQMFTCHLCPQSFLFAFLRHVRQKYFLGYLWPTVVFLQ